MFLMKLYFKMKTGILAVFLLGLGHLTAYATFTIEFSGGALFADNISSPLADGRLVIAVTTANANFSGPVIGSFVSGGDTLLGSWAIDSGFAGAGTYSAALNLTLGSGVATGQKVAIYWFSDITSLGTTPVNGTKYGTYRESSWLVPADTALVSFPLETENVGGSVSDSATVANLAVSSSAVPESSAYAALFGVAALGFAGCRRRRMAA